MLFAAPLGFMVVMRRARPMSGDDWANFDGVAFLDRRGQGAIPASTADTELATASF